jgi:penicillin-binding protein 1A
MGIAIIWIVILTAYPRLPDIEVLTDYRPKMPLQVFSGDGFLIGEFGEERRSPVGIRDVPDAMKHAILAAEDERFYQHYGIDPIGVMRAVYANMRGRKEGASTITMQLARTFFLNPEQTMVRKLYEALLSMKIEHSLHKDQILEIYINQIFLGQRAYGFAAAAQTYYGKPLADISIAEAAMLAGLPKAPSAFNPVVNPKRARIRQEYVLRRMRELSFINEAQYRAALDETLIIKRDSVVHFPVHAEYVAEMARQIAAERFSEDVYSAGIQVITTINKDEQETAYHALRQGVLDYDRRHGYRGAEAYIDMGQFNSDRDESLDIALQEFPQADGLIPAVVLEASPKQIKAYIHGGEIAAMTGDAIKFAAGMLGDKAPSDKKLRPGAIIRVMAQEKDWQITQLPEVEAAFIAASPENGAVHALVGGFDFNRNKYNHVTQAWRQPGSSFKPFIYSAALEKGFSPGSIVLDEPIEVPVSTTGSQVWRPKNYDGKYEGPMKLRTALAKSKNMPSIQLLQEMGPVYAQDYVTRFGFDAKRHPPYLTMALGAGSVTPWQMTSAYAVFANGGYRVNPYIVREIRDRQGRVLAQAASRQQAGDEKLRVIDPRNAYLMYSMLRDVAIYGTAARASATLKRHDLAGKTGTTNDYLDAWFCGFQKSVVGCAWMGFDQPHKLGNRETGGYAALPIWIAYMQQALKGVPEQLQPKPEGIAIAYGDMYYSENVPESDPAEMQEQEQEDWTESAPNPATHEGLPVHVPPARDPPKPVFPLFAP